jgi:SAM-dependent methyltransferase
MLRKILSNPTTKHMDIDSPQTTNLRRKIINDKPFLKDIYLDWYKMLLNEMVGDTYGRKCELGSGAGYLKTVCSEIITTDILMINDVDLVVDGCFLPFKDNQLSALVMINVLHHLPKPRLFFQEASRCLIDGGVITMIEPWPTTWSNIIFKYFHHEPFIPDAVDWEFEQSGPLSDANGALPWIIFQRDASIFQSEFPELIIEKIQKHTPFRYLLSGGVSLRSFTPARTSNFWRTVERLANPLRSYLAMFALIVIRKSVGVSFLL